MPELGLFPLPIVLVPTERIPLHIFEPRYRELIDECVTTDGEFGLALSTGDGAVHEIGTRARVADVLEVLEDGRMNVIVEGGERFRLLELTRGRAFTTGLVEPVADEDDPADEGDVERALEVFGELAALAESDVDVPDPASPTLDWELSARVDFGVDPKQELLAMTSPRLRMARLVDVLETSLEALRAEQLLRERAGRNGKVSPVDPEPLTERPRQAPVTTPAPPRRASPAAASTPSRSLDRVRAAEEEVAPPPAHDVVAERLDAVELRRRRSRPRSARAARRRARAA